MKKYIIKTKRLGMRFLKQDDIDFLRTLDKDPKVAKFFPDGTLSDDEIKQFVRDCVEECKKEGLPCFVIFNLATSNFVGEAYFDALQSGEVKVGYLFHKKHWNKGYATETLCALLDWAKGHIEADYIIAYAHKDNKASIRVMEKCGMHYYKTENHLGMMSEFYRIKNN
ncbi:GNAT family N-acetyltransferase [Legionella impletisoli]|uniref:N-acetyltransferase n=1 Tax=Legionella impletisoli TaxID=343510 RepID=A0A917NEM4_9GAMM|nr:GNAT family N-acetyltransferase [Legionella impletisoli]GGI93296.1 N-acetyltransferase [Legionella impletisoli]